MDQAIICHLSAISMTTLLSDEADLSSEMHIVPLCLNEYLSKCFHVAHKK